MEEEIDLRQYIVVLIKYWYWIVGIAVIAALAAFIVTSFVPPKYEAKALVAITKPQLLLQFTPDIRTESLLPEYQALPLIATNDELLTQLAQTLNDEGIALDSNQPVTIERLSQSLNATSSADPSLVELSVELGDPQKAADIANLWANLFVSQANGIYGQSEREKATFVTDLNQVEAELNELETNLAKIGAETGQGLLTAENRPLVEGNSIVMELPSTDKDGVTYANFGILGAELEKKAEALIIQKTRRDKLELLITQARELQTLVTENNLDETVATTGLLVELAQLTSQNSPVDLTLEINVDEDSSLKIEDVLATLESNLAATAAAIEKASLEVNELQAKMATQRQTFNTLSRQHTLKQEVYLALARKVAESDIGDEETNPIRLVSYASVPQQPVSSGVMFNTVMAGAFGLLVAVFGVFALEWWRAGSEGLSPDPHRLKTGQPVSEGHYGQAGQPH